MGELYKKSTGIELFNLIYPIGYVYIQFPQQKSPNDLWGKITKWQIIDYNGAFFRAQGGNASPYIDSDGELKMQEEGLPNITAYVGGLKDNFWGPGTGAVRVTNDQNSRARWEDDEINSFSDFNFNASWSNSIYGRSDHVTPTNYTIRIWKRIS